MRLKVQTTSDPKYDIYITFKDLICHFKVTVSKLLQDYRKAAYPTCIWDSRFPLLFPRPIVGDVERCCDVFVCPSVLPSVCLSVPFSDFVPFARWRYACVANLPFQTHFYRGQHDSVCPHPNRGLSFRRAIYAILLL